MPGMNRGMKRGMKKTGNSSAKKNTANAMNKARRVTGVAKKGKK
jgi:hypothetical protein